MVWKRFSQAAISAILVPRPKTVGLLRLPFRAKPQLGRALLLVGALLLPSAARADIAVVASIKPVHSLAAAIMQGAGTPHLLIAGNASPHSYSLKPSDARALQRAKLVFWIGEGLETFLEEPLEELSANATRVELAEAEGVRLLMVREGGVWDAHDDDDDHGKAHDDHGKAHDDHAKEHDDHAGHGHESADMHLWLDPLNAKSMAAAMVAALAEADPANAELYRRNGASLALRLDRLTADLNKQLQPVKDRPFIVFHDAYHYLEHRFGLAGAGSITLSPEVQPGAARLKELRERIAELGTVCVFSEPQFAPKLVDVVIEGTGVRANVLDPLGADLADGPDLYFKLMEKNAATLADCLAKSS